MDVVTDNLLVNQINLFRLTAGEQRKALAMLERMRAELSAKIAVSNLTEFNKARTKAMLKETEQTIRDYYQQIDLPLSGIASYEASATVQAMVGVSAVMPTDTVIKTLVSDMLIQGAPSADWWKLQSNETAFRFSNAVRQGMAQGETNNQIIQRIKPIIDTSKRGAVALVHTSIQTVANESRMAVFQANADILEGLEQLSTLDSHTSPVCISYSGAKWTMDLTPIGGSLPYNGGVPRHWNCRSVIVPIIPGLPDNRTRASDEGQLNANITFNDFLKNKSTAYQDELLGKGKADLWRDGKITLKDLVSQQGRPLTLEQLKKKL